MPSLAWLLLYCTGLWSVDVRLKGVGQLQVYPGCKGYSTSILLYGSSVVGDTTAQITGDLVSQFDLQYACCEELGVKVNFSQLPVEVVYRKTVADLDDLRYASRKISDLLEELNEQEWKNKHVAYRSTHSVLLFFVTSVIFAYALYKLYTCTHNRTVQTVYMYTQPNCTNYTNCIHVHATEPLLGSVGTRHRSYQQLYNMLLDRMIKRALITLMVEAVGTI